MDDKRHTLDPRALWPDELPDEVREHVPELAIEFDASTESVVASTLDGIAVASSGPRIACDQCQCQCLACRDAECDSCSTKGCHDSNCETCPAQIDEYLARLEV
jgi:hypothetical protein